LDSKTGQQILALFDELVASGRTILMVTHDPSVGQRCHRVIQLHDGLIVKDERNPQHKLSEELGQLSGV
jgi:putative ABC transport system ATP-binding protein